MDRFQGHLYNISTRNVDDTIGRHFGRNSHGTITDLKIHILEFIKAAPECTLAAKLRDKTELKWIHRLNTTEPRGLNLLD